MSYNPMLVSGNINPKEIERLVEKWDKKGFKVSEISDRYIAGTTAQLLENAALNMESTSSGLLAEATSTTTGDVADFKRLVMPLTRRIFPNLIANNLVSVQPMNGPVGLAFALRARYKTGSYAGQEIGYNTINPEYSGDQTASPLSGGGGVITSAGERMSSVDPTATSQIQEVGIETASTTITAKTRKLKARYSLESQQDLKSQQGVDIESMVLEVLQYEIAAEIDREIINKMHGLCTVGNNNLTSYAVASGDGTWSQEKFRNLYTKIVNAAAKIAISSRRGPGNFIIASSGVITALDTLGNFLLSPTNSSAMNLSPGIAKVGSIEGRFDVYRDTFATSEYVIVGYKGPNFADAGIIYSPYVPVMISKTMEPTSFYPVIGCMTRYAVTDNLFGSQNFYQKINIDFGTLL